MNRRDFAVLACRLIAVYLLVESIFFFASFLHNWIAFALDPEAGLPASDWNQWSHLALLAFPMVAALLLLRFSEAIGSRLVPKGEEPAPSSPAAPGAWLAFGLVLIGVLDLVRSVPELVNFVGYAWSSAPELYPVPLVDRFGTGLIASALRVTLGLWLVLGSRGIARVIGRLRGAGLQPDERPWLEQPR
ncbi:MAG TPA: hypothetical protein VMS76_07310 [Planctomycetota bacterium]|nr:hypothetical protein [Planctomycetota bacterium]